MITVKRVEMMAGPIGSCGFRSGTWTAITDCGKKFKFFGSLPHETGMDHDRMMQIARSAVKMGRIEMVPGNNFL